MTYEFEEPFIVDTTKYESTFGAGRHGHGRCYQRDHYLVSQPSECDVTVSDSSSDTELAATDAWSQRVRRVGGFIQLAFVASG